jgi:predicted transcriptional regulator
LGLKGKAKQSQAEPKMGDTNQQSLAFRAAEVRVPHHDDPDLIDGLPTFRSALRHAIARSGFTQEAVAEALGIDSASFSRMVNEPRKINARQREFPCEKLGDFARVTGTLVAHQWLCHRVGQEPVSIRETKLQRLEREVEELRANAARITGFDRRAAA